MTPHMLSFSCAFPLSLTITLQRLSEADPRNVYNPYPDLADTQNFRRASTQPLPRITYLPFDTSPIVERLYSRHEAGHLDLDFTPFKAWGRVLLLCAYQKVDVLLRTTEWDKETQESWNSLKRLRRDLEKAFYSVALSEELLANAISFNCSTEPHLQMYEKAVVQKAAEDFPNADFEGLYYRTFKPLVKWWDEKPLLRVLLCTFLQGVQNSEGYEEVIDSESRCKLLDENIKEIKSAQQALDWIAHATNMIDEVDSTAAYKATLIMLVRSEEYVMTPEIAEAMYVVAEGKRMPRIPQAPALQEKLFRRLPVGPTPRTVFRLYPTEVNGQWCISGVVEWRRKRLLADALLTVGWYESIFEQLSRNPSHFFCPNYIPGNCSCPLGNKQAVTRRM